MIKTFKIVKKGRKYFDCKLNTYSAKLVINSVVENAVAGDELTLEVNDLSDRTSFGTFLKFEPVSASNKSDELAAIELSKKTAEAKKWLGWAEGQAADGLVTSQAIQAALRLAYNIESLKSRYDQLEINIKKNMQTKIAQAKKYEQEKLERQAKRYDRIFYYDEQAPELNKPKRVGNSVLVFESTGKSFKNNDDGSDDWMGVSGWGRYYYYRTATQSEVEQLEVDEAESAKVKAEKSLKKLLLGEVVEFFDKNGVTPENVEKIEMDEVLLDSRNIHGSGSCYVINPKNIWFLQNWGMDGDDWARQNYQGHIARKIEYNDEIAQKLRTIAS